MNIPELLIPAGSMESLKTAVLYGADAVYLGGEAFGLRAKAKNFDRAQLKDGIAFAHQNGVRVHVTVNIIAHDNHLDGLEEYLLFLKEAGADALIVADAGVIRICRRVVPDMELHLSTQASATNAETFAFWHEMGVKRIVCARELSLEEIAHIRANTPETLQIEAFAHGAMCISISGRCLLSSYLSGRDSNLGMCSHPCRWKYSLMEESRPGEYFPITEGEEGTYIFNSKDLCMIEYLPELIKAGVCSLKIEGRMKTPLYVAMVCRAYRQALDDLKKDPALYEAGKPLYKQMLSLVSHRDYTTGFYLGQPGPADQIYDSASYIKQVEFAGKVLENNPSTNEIFIEQRGKFLKGETLYLIPPSERAVPSAALNLLPIPVTYIRREDGTFAEDAPHAQEHLYIPATDAPSIQEGSILVKYIK
ncbi:MAG: U32 family peptidase [Firmicutes bacterium]|nr:U32 family peptidase [Bacillota bacterium]